MGVTREVSYSSRRSRRAGFARASGWAFNESIAAARGMGNVDAPSGRNASRHVSSSCWPWYRRVVIRRSSSVPEVRGLINVTRRAPSPSILVDTM